MDTPTENRARRLHLQILADLEIYRLETLLHGTPCCSGSANKLESSQRLRKALWKTSRCLTTRLER